MEDGNMSNELITVRHILCEKKFEIEDVLRKLKQGSSFSELAKDYSICPSSQRGGSLGEFPRGKMVADFDKVAFSLKVGETSGVVVTRFGYHLILRES